MTRPETETIRTGYYLGGLMEIFLGVEAEQTSPEDVGEPLSAQAVGRT
jgi:hypothetical protein